MPHEALVVEDDADQSAMVAGALATLGWKTHVAKTAALGFSEAVRLKPALIITDIELPDSSGFALCQQLRAHQDLRGVPIVMVTGTYKRDEDRLRATGLGADAYLLKPYRVAELLEIVKKLVA